jgi:hypothetical protein
MLALSLPVLVLMMTFGIDAGRWWDYKRNLQNRADAAALAAGNAYGGTCFVASPSPASLAAIGQVGVLYSGPGPTSDLPAGYTAPVNPYNQPSAGSIYLTKASLSDFHVVLNGKRNWYEAGKTNDSFNMTDNGHAGTFCDSSSEDPSCGPAPQKCPLVDVNLTQAKVGLFFPLPFSSVPAITAHARVSMQGQSGGDHVSAVAVRDAAQTPCLYAYFIDSASHTLLATAILHKEAPSGDDPVTWDNGPNGTPVPIGGSQQVTVEAFPNDCDTPPAGNVYDAPEDVSGNPLPAQGTGIVFINTFQYDSTQLPQPGTPGPPATNGDDPRIIGVGSPAQAVTLTTTDCVEGTSISDPYFSNNDTTCHVTVHANVAFNQYPTVGSGPKPHNMVTATDQNTGTSITVNVDSAGASNIGPFVIDPGTGAHNFTLSWEQQVGSTSKGACSRTSNPCKGNFTGTQQSAFSAFEDGSDPPDDSGEFITAQIGQSVGGVITVPSQYNSIKQGTTPNLVVTFKLGGLHNSKPADPPLILRFPVAGSPTSGSKRTGLIDCGQGTGNPYDAIYSGCPDAIQIYTGPPCVTPPSTTPITCVKPSPGDKWGQIKAAIEDRIGASCDYWQLYKQNNGDYQFAPNDPRAITMIVTRVGDLSGNGGPNSPPIPILGFTTFYVTGWDTDKYIPPGPKIPGCTAPTDRDEVPLPGAKKYSTSKAIWGHFIKYTGSGAGTGAFCDPSSFGNCVAVLTR